MGPGQVLDLNGGGARLAYYVLVPIFSIHAQLPPQHLAPLLAPKHAIHIR